MKTKNVDWIVITGRNSKSFSVGDKVNYTTGHKLPENGIVKTIRDTGEIFVVFNCGNNWENYMLYTAALVDSKFLFLGWT